MRYRLDVSTRTISKKVVSQTHIVAYFLSFLSCMGLFSRQFKSKLQCLCQIRIEDDTVCCQLR